MLRVLVCSRSFRFYPLVGVSPHGLTLTSIRHLSLSWASPIQSIYLHPTSWRSSLILSTHLHLCLPSGLFPFGFPTQDPIHPLLLTHTRHMPSPSHSSRFITCTIFGEEYNHVVPRYGCLQSKHPACECFLTYFFTGRGC